MMNSSSPPSSSQPLPFDGTARRGGLLHPRFSDPSPIPPAGEQAPPVRAAQQRCARCGGELSVSWLEGRWRHACVGGGGGGSSSGISSSSNGNEGGCGTIAYTNPLLVVGAIITDVDALDTTQKGEKKIKPRVLLCKRAIEPRKGSWTLPAGYLELGESAAEGAARETWEEARARVEIFGPYFHAVSGSKRFFVFLLLLSFFETRVENSKKKAQFHRLSLLLSLSVPFPINRTSPRSARPTSCSEASS